MLNESHFFGLKMVTSDIYFLKVYITLYPFKVCLSLTANYWQLDNFLLFLFTYSESPWNFVLDRGLTCKDYWIGIGIMTTLKKFAADACTGLLRRGHHHT